MGCRRAVDERRGERQCQRGREVADQGPGAHHARAAVDGVDSALGNTRVLPDDAEVRRVTAAVGAAATAVAAAGAGAGAGVSVGVVVGAGVAGVLMFAWVVFYGYPRPRGGGGAGAV